VSPNLNYDVIYFFFNGNLNFFIAIKECIKSDIYVKLLFVVLEKIRGVRREDILLCFAAIVVNVSLDSSYLAVVKYTRGKFIMEKYSINQRVLIVKNILSKSIIDYCDDEKVKLNLNVKFLGETTCQQNALFIE